MALRPGMVLRNRYRVLAAVGHGGMGSIYQAEDQRLPGRLCAVKEIYLDPGADSESARQAQEQFFQEAQVLARLDHPNLPKVSDFFAENGYEYLVMDFVAGQDLKQIMDDARREGRLLDERQVLGWAGQLCDALEYLHSQEPPVLHRDIKPANIKLTPNGLIKLVDFGLVKLMASDDARTITVLQGRGTAHYTPLEQYGGDTGHTDARSDIYSLGGTLYHLLTNQPPAEAKERFLRPAEFRPPRELHPDLSARTDRAILWAMQMHPDDRPPDVATLRRALLGESHESWGLAPSLPSERSFPLDAILAALVAALLVLALLLTLAPSVFGL